MGFIISEVNNLNNFLCSDIFSCKIKALANAYGFGQKFCKFYSVGEAFLVQLDSDFVLSTSKNIDYEELASFLKMSSYKSVFLSTQSGEKLNAFLNGELVTKALYERKTSFSKNDFEKQKLEINPPLDEVFWVLESAFPGISHDDWYVDINHKIRHNISKVFLYDKVAAATAAYDIENNILLTLIGTHAEHRKGGTGGKMLTQVLNYYSNFSDKNINVVCKKELKDFYERNGFNFKEEVVEIYKK